MGEKVWLGFLDDNKDKEKLLPQINCANGKTSWSQMSIH
jgi:hypothetical protein